MNKNLPLVSIITVTYNAEKYLEQTIESVIGQDYPNIEYIIIDGGSDDDTIDIIKKYEKHINYWVREADHGIYDAMNKGVTSATGNWINFLNAGDSFCEKTTISQVANHFSKNIDFVSGDIYYFTKNQIKYLKAEGLTNIYSGIPFCHQALFTCSKILKKYKFNTNYKICADYDFVLKCYIKNHNFKFVDFAIANFVDGGISQTNKILARIEELYIQSRYLKNIDKIYEHETFAKLESYKKNNNKVFVKLINKLYEKLDLIDLSNKKFVLYGYGTVGELIYNKYSKNILEVVDQNYINLNQQNLVNVKSVKTLSLLKSEYILISVLGKEKEIIQNLTHEYKIKESLILSVEI